MQFRPSQLVGKRSGGFWVGFLRCLLWNVGFGVCLGQTGPKVMA